MEIEYGAETLVSEAAFAGKMPPVMKSAANIPAILLIVFEMLNRNS